MKTLEIFGNNYFGHWENSRIACRGIIIKDGCVLLSYETRTGQYMIPGGGLEEGEDERECCTRELAEETGFLVSPSECVLEMDEFYEDWKYISRYFFGTVTVGMSSPSFDESSLFSGLQPMSNSANAAIK